MIEIPVMLSIAFLVCRWLVRRSEVPPNFKNRVTMAVWFLSLLLLAEFMLGVTLFERTFVEQRMALMTTWGLLGLSAQIIAALFPFVTKQAERK